jgi:hypothetical protein
MSDASLDGEDCSKTIEQQEMGSWTGSILPSKPG